MSAFKTCFVKAPGMTHKKCPCKRILGITFKLTQRLGLTKPSTQIKKELNQELPFGMGHKLRGKQTFGVCHTSSFKLLYFPILVQFVHRGSDGK